MKTFFSKSKFAVLALLFLTFASCSNDDDNDDSPAVQPPSITYAATNLNATFFHAGNSNAPTVNWNGNPGSFSLATPVTGLTINTTTGVLNWTKDLPIDIHTLQVVATNSAGQTTVNLTLDNPLQGVFTGTYDSILFFQVEFIENGTMLLRANSETNPDTGTGTWTKNGNIIAIDYTYDIGGDFSLSGTLTVGTTAIYSGDWFYDHGAISVNQGGTFEMILD